ncbi:amidohydrolase family protein [Polyangium sorediatum]|uniref:Amidohydrolase family protein n=1 Tax=Polyangium sorediatum TaxID=889274 RepID=A0ABT6NIX7_9BACT|nr:amidohydrolase family protein [Polyangium sorediatum]MDI1428262.1 amidohydrolase family protein [Polyangium sorediatum]
MTNPRSLQKTFVSSLFVLIAHFAATEALAQPARPAPAPAPAAAKAATPAATAPLAIVGGRVHTGTGEVLEDATILVEKGLVQKIGKGLAVPAGVTTIDAKGAIVTPGFVDALTSIGLVEISLEDSTHDDDRGGKDPIRAAFRAADGYNPASTVVGITRAEGVTSAAVVPLGGLFSGQSAWADFDGDTRESALTAGPLALHVHLDGSLDGDRGGPAAALHLAREVFDDARTFQKNRAAWERNQSRPFAASRLDLEAVGDALAGRVPVVFHVDRASDILAAVALAKEFGLRPVIAGGAEAWKIAPRLAESKVPVIVNPLEPGPTTFDTLGMRNDNAALLHAAGVPVVITTNDTHNARKLRQVAGNAVRAGLPHAAAIAAITSAPAAALGLGAKYGTLAPGKVANLVVWSGDPLEIASRPLAVVIRGKKVDLGNRQSALFTRYRKLPIAR